MSSKKWSSQNIPNQKDRIIIITGASSGLGKEATKVLAGKNATVIMAVRDTHKAETVVKEIISELPNAKVEIRNLDLNSLDSVKSFAKEFISDYDQLDVLINNAGVMMCPYSKTKDGFEIQMGVNHLGHFALTGLLMPLLIKTKNSRVVATSSIAHKSGNINFDDINWEKRKYKTIKAYSDSKLANLYFAYELAKKHKEDPNYPFVTAAHPGYTYTDLQRHSNFWKILNPIFSQKVEKGVLPTLRAATDKSANIGDFYGPEGFLELKGFPVLVLSNNLSHNKENAKRLWDISEKLTGVKY